MSKRESHADSLSPKCEPPKHLLPSQSRRIAGRGNGLPIGLGLKTETKIFKELPIGMPLPDTKMAKKALFIPLFFICISG